MSEVKDSDSSKPIVERTEELFRSSIDKGSDYYGSEVASNFLLTDTTKTETSEQTESTETESNNHSDEEFYDAKEDDNTLLNIERTEDLVENENNNNTYLGITENLHVPCTNDDLIYHDCSQNYKEDGMLQQLPTEYDETCFSDPESKYSNSILFKDIREFIAKVGLNNFYPQKMGLLEVMRIDPQQEETTYHDLPWVVVRNLLMANFTSRDNMVEVVLQNIYPNQTTSENEDEKDELDVWLDLDLAISSDDINPLDLLLAIFLCSTSSLRHILVTKLFMCKLAIPLVIPLSDHRFQLLYSPLHSVVIDDISDYDSSRQKDALECPSHVVSFIRFGRPSTSKSHSINTLLSDTNHNSFFNENCPLGRSKKVISNGMIEVSWFIPSRNAMSFSNVTVFMNLRGDSEFQGDKVAFLQKVSDVIVVFLDLGDLKKSQKFSEFWKSYDGKKILAIDAKHYKKEDVKNIFKNFPGEELPKTCVLMSYDSKDTTKTEAKKKLIIQISDNLANCLPKKLSNVFDRDCCLIVKDEESPNQKMGKEIAISITNLLPSDTINVKAIVAPMQGKPLEKWSKHLKLINKSSEFKSLEERSKYETEMKELRQKQLDMSRNMHPFMHKCLDVLSNFEGEKFVTVVDWLKLLLNKRTLNTCSKLMLQYKNDINAMNEAKQNAEQHSETNNDEINILKEKAAKSKAELNAAPFRFDHILREISQYFECLKSTKKEISEREKNMLELLPHIGAKLLLLGHPLEILDGDTTNVPILWVEDVLKQLKLKLGDKKLLALSVVGLQSSGKSTLLNTMFGLQFAVSVGRCTSGVSIQLVPMRKMDFDFDYVVVIDTEGLRAPKQAENGDFRHDNMLATFVIGLGDIAIVNVKGENTSEVKEILQIAVHAFLRLKLANKNLNLKQSCVFVHQNVADADASSKMVEERQLFVQTLDDMAVAAAEREDIADIKTFTQIMEFDSDKNVSYFTDLWHGDPPMAPVNPGYSSRVSEVRNNILFQIASKRKTYLTITDTVARVKDLWAGILKDDFVYSFRNSLELKAYSEMESHYHQKVWELEKFQLKFILETAKTTLYQGDVNNLNEMVIYLGTRFSTEIVHQVKKASDSLAEFIDSNKLKEVMIQWKASKLMRLKIVSEDLISNCHFEISHMKDEVKADIIQRKERVRYEAEINDLARNLANELKGQKPDDKVLSQRFNTMWSTWLRDLNIKFSEKGMSVLDQIGNLLAQYYPSNLAFMVQFKLLKEDNIDVYFDKLEGSLKPDITFKHISIRKSVAACASLELQENHREKSIKVVDCILRKVDVRLDELRSQDIRFKTLYIHEILKYIIDAFAEHNSQIENEFTLPSTLQAIVIDHVMCYCTFFFTQLDKKYDEKHSLKGRMNDYKRVVWTLFQKLVDQKTEDVVAVVFVKETLRESVINHINGCIHIPVAERIFTFFCQEKYEVMKGIMIDLANKDNFDDYIAFIEDPAAFARKWISRYLHASFFEMTSDGVHQYGMETKKIVQTVFESLSKAAKNSNEKLRRKVEDKEGVSGSVWIDTFLEEISGLKLPISRVSFTHVSTRLISDMQNFTNVLVEDLERSEIEINAKFAETTGDTVRWESDIMTLIMDKIWGCEEKCMFCKEPCKNIDKDHVKYNIDHHCIQHRPQGIGGFRKVIDGTLAVDFCNYLIQTDTEYWFSNERLAHELRPYKDYKKHFPDWNIQPTYDTSKYWMYVLRTYQHQFKRHYRAQLPKIPEIWNDITKEDAIESLSLC